MQKRTLGRTGYSISPLGFGSAPAGYLKTEQDRITRILNLLLDAGVNLIDTAASYPGSEQAIAKAVGHRRDEFVLVSKCGQKLPDVPGAAWSAELITATVDRALRNLQTDHLDVMLLHSCDENVLRQGDALAALVAARNAGKIRFAGYSGDNSAAAYAAELPDVAVIETSVSIADQVNIDLVLPAAQRDQIGILAKRPIANAAWKHVEDQRGLYKNYAQTYHDRLKQMKLDPAKLGFTGPNAWSELALRFTISQPAVDCAIIGTTNPDNAKANLAVVEKGPLSHDVVQQIRNAFRAADPSGSWTGQT
jgi:aryl-alcohol dehydrogenase-like predicted oxidoreductase